jgi:NAD-dependent DNA ligase
LHSQLFNFLEKQDFVVNSNYLAKADIKAAIAYCEKWEEKRDELEYELQGLGYNSCSIEAMKW